MHPHCFHCPPTDPVYTDPSVVYQDYYYPQIVPVVHTVQIVKRHHCVPVPKHICNYVVKDEYTGPVTTSMKRNSRGGRR